MRTRPALVVTLAAAVAFGGAATAAPKAKPKPKPVAPVCNQVTDEKGDAEIVRPQAGMDVVSADIATGAKKLVTTIRLAAKPDTLNPEAAGSSRYYFEYTAPGSENPQYLQASIAFATGTATFRSGEIPRRSNKNRSWTVMTSPSMPVISEIAVTRRLPSDSRVAWITRFTAEAICCRTARSGMFRLAIATMVSRRYSASRELLA